MGMRWDRCWFENCHDRGTTLDLDGQHPRSLCGKHADGLRTALGLPGTIRISWGRSKEELLAELEKKLAILDADHGAAKGALEAHRVRPIALDADGIEIGSENDEQLERAEWLAYSDRSSLLGEISEVHRRSWDHPVVRVHVKHD